MRLSVQPRARMHVGRTWDKHPFKSLPTQLFTDNPLERAAGVGETWIETESGFEILAGFRVAVLLGQNQPHAELDSGHGVARRQRGAADLQAFLEAPLLSQRQAEDAPDARIIGAELQRLPESRFRLLKVA